MYKVNSSCLIAKTRFPPDNQEIPKKTLKHKAPDNPVHLDIDQSKVNTKQSTQ